ncbi:hypothetical protein Gogos_019164, partial [Gossypium gossypioides]|nr:hypothetical protein [Gossypium gossypioides]
MWSPPRANTIKCNFDTAYNSNLLKSVTEIVFRDSERLILASCTYHNPFIADATTAEAKACLQAVMVAEELSFRNLTIERDSLTVIKKIRASKVDKSNIAAIVHQRVWIEKATHKVEMIAEKDRSPLN